MYFNQSSFIQGSLYRLKKGYDHPPHLKPFTAVTFYPHMHINSVVILV